MHVTDRMKDVFTAEGAEKIKAALERELNTIRKTRSCDGWSDVMFGTQFVAAGSSTASTTRVRRRKPSRSHQRFVDAV